MRRALNAGIGDVTGRKQEKSEGIEMIDIEKDWGDEGMRKETNPGSALQ